jgi:osmoprotectant transport system ATP-binding protein
MIRFEQVNKVYAGGIHAVRDLDLEIERGETVVLLGTSGSGKTTTMKMVNRLLEPSSGRISVDGRDIMAQNPIGLRRRIGYAIQHIGLFPHMSVAENISVTPSLLGWRPERIRGRVDELLQLVGLDPETFRNRRPRELSGGQRQRIGVARALAADPDVVLMDEPFGALDPITREQLQDEFLDLEGAIRKTVIFVTHDVFEAVKMGDRIALMDGGVIQQIGTPRELVDNPVNQFVDDFLGHHRFQLALMTRTAGSIVAGQPIPATTDGIRIPARASLVAALDEFKKNEGDQATVYKNETPVGSLSKKQLLAAIAEVLGQTGADATIDYPQSSRAKQ